MKNVPNELAAYYLSVNALNPFPGAISASRAQMFGSHISQRLVIKGQQQRYLVTGLEKEFGKFTFSVKMPVDGRIISVHERYRQTIGQDSISENPQTIVIYEDERTKEIGIIDLPRYCSYHQYFGFQYETKPGINKLARGNYIPKDTIFLDSPSVGAHGEYKYGIQLNMAYMSHPSVSEDGIMISRDVLEKLKFKTYERRVVEFGNKKYPLNLYGTAENFKSFPDIGEYIREDGLLMAFRTYDPLLAPVEQSIFNLMEHDPMFDDSIYGAGGGGKIVDIQVYSDKGGNLNTPTGMDTQANKYVESSRIFYQNLVNEWQKLRKLHGDSLQITPEFHRMIVEAYAAIDDSSVSKVQKIHRMAPLDDYRIEFVIEYEVTPSIGFKLTDTTGGKAVICHIAEPHEMPVDEAGNRADIVMDGNSTISRMNIARLYEQYFNAASRDVLKHIRKVTGILAEDKHPHNSVNKLFETSPHVFDEAYKYLMGYYNIMSPKQFHWLNDQATQEQKLNHLAEVLKDFIYIYTPTDNLPELIDMQMAVEKHYRPTYGPVEYIGYSGRKVKTESPVRIGSVYMMLLEKTGDDWSSVSSGRLHHFGFLAPVNKFDKHSQPFRMQPVRVVGEAEARILVSYCGQNATAEIMDRNSSPSTHKAVVANILKADKPTNIESVVNRKETPLGSSKSLQLLSHIFYTAGIEMAYKRNNNYYPDYKDVTYKV